MKTKEELNTPKEEVKTTDRKLIELDVEELEQVTGGSAPSLIVAHAYNLGVAPVIAELKAFLN